MKENPSENLTRQLQTSQELDSRKTGQHHMTTTVPRGKSHKGLAPVRPVKSTGQTGHTWAARDEQHPRLNFPKSNSRSPESFHGIVQHFGDSRNTSWELHSQYLVHKNLLNQEESPKSSPFAHGFGRGIKGKRNMKGSSIYPPPNPKEKGLEIAPRKSARKGSENHQKERTGTTHLSLEESRRIIYTYQRGSYNV
jgi:hypothetical protein